MLLFFWWGGGLHRPRAEDALPRDHVRTTFFKCDKRNTCTVLKCASPVRGMTPKRNRHRTIVRFCRKTPARHRRSSWQWSKTSPKKYLREENSWWRSKKHSEFPGSAFVGLRAMLEGEGPWPRGEFGVNAPQIFLFPRKFCWRSEKFILSI